MTFAVFLDRDGTMIADRHYLADPDGVELLPGSAAGLRKLACLGARLVVVTNQSGIGRGLFTADALEHVHERLRALLADEGVELAGIYACPHVPAEGCDCRKPSLGLFTRAAAELGLDLDGSFVLGDRDADVEAGRRLGAVAIRVGGEPRAGELHAPDLLASAALVERLRGRS